MDQAERSPLEYLKHRLITGESLHLGSATFWYQPTQRQFFLRLGNGTLCAGPFERLIWTLLNSLGAFQPRTEQEEHSDLYTISSPDSDGR